MADSRQISSQTVPMSADLMTRGYVKVCTGNELLQLIEARPPEVELVMTGRYAPLELIGATDLVTEMREVKHYYNQGVLERKGIES